MALRILQFGAVFAVGYCLRNGYPAAVAATASNQTEVSAFSRGDYTPGKNLSLSLRLKDPKDATVQKGHGAILRCDAESSYGTIEYTWFHNGNEIPQGDPRWTVNQDGSLLIPKVVAGRKSHSVTGEYSCKVRNNAGALLSNKARLRVASIESDFSKHPANQTVPVGQSAVFSCSVHSTPPVEIRWEYNNLTLPHNSRYVPLPNGFLFIYDVQSTDSGFYRCKATNDILNKTRYSRSSYLTVATLPTEDQAPIFLPLDSLTNASLPIGKKLNLHCPVIGQPTPTVQWTNSNGLVLSTSNVLQIDQVEPHHSGQYTCTAYNSLGHTSQNYYLEVVQRPFFNVTPESKSHTAGSTARIKCRAGGIPDPRIVWLKDGRPIAFNVSRKNGELVFSKTSTNDTGIYQCVAVNSVGRAWSAAQILINISHGPPQNLQCRPYDSSSVCLSWLPPFNVSVLGYSVQLSYKTPDGQEMLGPDPVTKETYKHVEDLKEGTNYTFSVRVYSNTAGSDPSEKVTCKPGITGHRNLQIELTKPDTVLLTWSKISLDRSCEGEEREYEVHWREEGQKSEYNECTAENKFILSGLSPGNYEFLVTPDDGVSSWTSFTIPEVKGAADADNSSKSSFSIKVDGNPVSGYAVNLNWTSVSKKIKFYTVCYIPASLKNCEKGSLIKSFTNKVHIDKLLPNTTYEFRVRSHMADGVVGPFSKSFKIKTPEEVPSPVVELKYKIINDSAVCLSWHEPQHKNGEISKYIISYTPDPDWPLEQWINVSMPVNRLASADCWRDQRAWLMEQDFVSVAVANLNADEQYMLIVRAVSNVGIGHPLFPIIINTKVLPPADTTVDMHYHQKVGIIIGTIVVLACIALFIICILLRRRCVKRRVLARARLAASNNYYPAVAHYASHVGAVHVRLEDTCTIQAQESQHLVNEAPTANIPPVSPGHCDTKGADDFPNGHLNGAAKPYMNGHLSNNHVHITENPQYYAFECNGQANAKKPKKVLAPFRLEEDTNSNVKPSKFYDLYRLFENSKKPKNHQQRNRRPDRNPKGSDDEAQHSENEALDVTHLTCLDDSLGISVVNNNSTRLPTVLGPNG